MIFTTYWFVAFAVGFFSLYYVAFDWRLRLAVLLVGSVIFHAHFAGPAGVIPVFVLGLLTYLAALSGNRPFVVFVISLNAAALIFYKYTVFLVTSLIGPIFPDYSQAAIESLQHQWLPSAPPLAISFFVFEFVHYLVDVLKGNLRIKNPTHFMLFGLFWPSVVAGPVKRYEQFLPSVKDAVISRVASEDVMWGAARVSVGFLKKTVADNLTAWIDRWDDSFAALPIDQRWAIFIGLGFRILLDFSGYSDMAIGFARMMGVRLPENFNWPYLSRSIADFWHRWHISLSSWIRDYLYIPLGGSRHGVVRRMVNAIIAFTLCGLWHGAGWNFAVWGVYHGVGVAVNGLISRQTAPIVDKLPPVALVAWHGASWAATMAFVFVGWLFFFYPLWTAVNMFTALRWW